MSTNMLLQSEYVKAPNLCPNTVCRSSDIDAGGVDIDGGTASQEVSCNDCGAEWVDKYELVRYHVTRLPE